MILATDNQHRIAIAGSITFFAAAIYGHSLYPFAQTELALGLFFYSLSVYWRPVLTMALLPLLLTLINLAPWSGSLFLEEFDLFILANVGVLMARGLYIWRIPLDKAHGIFVALIVFSGLASLAKAFDQLPVIDANSVINYANPSNAIRIFKGIIWPLLLFPGIAAIWINYRRQSSIYLAWGFALSALVVGLIAMWERGVLATLSESASPFVVFSTLFNFTTRYRITGMFSEMNVGGEYIDGFITMTWPFGILLALHARQPMAKMIGVAAHLSILYAAAATFSRVTYIGVGIGSMVMAIYLIRLWKQRATALGASPELTTITLNVLAMLALAAFYLRGGVIGLYAGLASWCMAIIMGRYDWVRGKIGPFTPTLILFLFAAGTLAYSMIASNWVSNSISYVCILSLVLAASIVFSGMRLGERLGTSMNTNNLVTMVVLAVGSVAIVTPAIFGYRMTARFATSAIDIPSRVGHWQSSLELMDTGPTTILFGMGLGQFPHEYIKHHTSAKEGSYSFGKEGGNRYLTLVEGEHFRLTQRINMPAHSSQTLSLRLRSVSDSYKLRLRLCRRHIIPAREQDANCLVYARDLNDTDGKWQDIQWNFDMGPLGDNGVLGRHPLTLEITNLSDCNRKFMPTSVIDVDDIAIRNSAGVNAVRNGDFSQGFEGWFPHSDWSHMRWHLKNTWANIYFDQGLFGVASFAGFLGMLFFSLIRHVKSQRPSLENPFQVASLISLTSFLVLSPLGSPLDAPRLLTIAYLLFFSLAIDLSSRSNATPNRLVKKP